MGNHLVERLCVSAVLLSIASAAYAAPELSADWMSCAPGGGFLCAGAAGPTMTDFDSGNVIAVDPTDPNNNSFIHVYGNNSTTIYGSRASGNNSYASSSIFHLNETLTGNDRHIFGFTIQPGEVTIMGSNLTHGEQLSASLLIQVQFGDLSSDVCRFSDACTKFEIKRGLSLDPMGDPIFTPESNIGVRDDMKPILSSCSAPSGGFCLSYIFDSIIFPLDDPLVLGTGDGELNYVIDAEAGGNVIFSGAGGTAPATQGMSVARSGDPNGPFTPLGGIVSLPSQVPEPSSFLLVSIGLTGLGFLRLRRRGGFLH